MIRIITIAAVLAALTLAGCSLLDSPTDAGNEGTVTLVLVRSNPEATTAFEGHALKAFSAAMPVVDSLCILVFPPTGGVETKQCITVGAADDSVEVNLTVIAENNKRVSVELFEAGRLLFFGVDEDVDVAPNQTTNVLLSTAPFEITTFTRDMPIVRADSVFSLEWNSVADAASYRVQRSSTPDFQTIDWQTSISDTTLSGSLPVGAYYFRVMAENPYSSTTPAEQYVYAYDPPVISSVVDEDANGETLRLETLTVTGTSLDYPGTEFYFGSYLCNVVAWGGNEVTIQVPPNSISGRVTVQNALGGDISTDYIGVMTIAYIGEDPDSAAADLGSALAYMALIEGYSELDDARTVFLPYQWLGIFPVSIFDVIVIGNDTFSKGRWAGGDNSRVAAVAFSGANVLGIGVGGSGYFDTIGLNIGLSNVSASQQTNVYCWAPSSNVFTKPNNFSAVLGQSFDIYNTSDWVVSALLPGPATPGQMRYGARGAAGSYFPLVEEITSPSGTAIVNLLWGYEAPPWDMSANGDRLFENTITHIYKDKRSKLP